jgi:hypothetical protein
MTYPRTREAIMYSVELLPNFFVRVQDRESQLVGLYDRDGKYLHGDLRLGSSAYAILRQAGIAPSGSSELRSKYGV